MSEEHTALTTARKGKIRPDQPETFAEPEPKYKFDDQGLTRAVIELTRMARDLFQHLPDGERITNVFVSTALRIEPLTYEITILQMLLFEELEKPSTVPPPRQRSRIDVDACRSRIAAFWPGEADPDGRPDTGRVRRIAEQ